MNSIHLGVTSVLYLREKRTLSKPLHSGPKLPWKDTAQTPADVTSQVSILNTEQGMHLRVCMLVRVCLNVHVCELVCAYQTTTSRAFPQALFTSCLRHSLSLVYKFTKKISPDV